MKKLLLFLMLAVGALSAFAQDVIVKNDGSTVLCKIIGVSSTEVTYTKWTDQNGPQYIMDRTLISNINYQDGRQEKFNEQTTNAYTPGIQQTGASNFNDNALMRMDLERNNSSFLKKAKKNRIIGWAVGAPIALTGFGLMIGSLFAHDEEHMWPLVISGGAAIVAGAGTLTGCLVKARQLERKANMIASAPILEHEFNFGNGSSLCAGIDMIRDKNFKQSTFGIGLHYNF